MRVLTLSKGKKRKYEVYAILKIGDEWEIEIEDETYIVDSDSIFENLDIQSSLVPSIVNWFCAFKDPLTDDYTDHWGYENFRNDARTSLCRTI